MTESQYVTAIIKAINDMGGKAVKFVETEYSQKGTPDIIGCYTGRMIVIEAKIKGNTTSDIQNEELKQWGLVGAINLVVEYPKDKPERIARYIKILIDSEESIDYAEHFWFVAEDFDGINTPYQKRFERYE